jgi:hypothetical protein
VILAATLIASGGFATLGPTQDAHAWVLFKTATRGLSEVTKANKAVKALDNTSLMKRLANGPNNSFSRSPIFKKDFLTRMNDRVPNRIRTRLSQEQYGFKSKAKDSDLEKQLKNKDDDIYRTSDTVIDEDDGIGNSVSNVGVPKTKGGSTKKLTPEVYKKRTGHTLKRPEEPKRPNYSHVVGDNEKNRGLEIDYNAKRAKYQQDLEDYNSELELYYDWVARGGPRTKPKKPVVEPTSQQGKTPVDGAAVGSSKNPTRSERLWQFIADNKGKIIVGAGGTLILAGVGLTLGLTDEYWLPVAEDTYDQVNDGFKNTEQDPGIFPTGHSDQESSDDSSQQVSIDAKKILETISDN